MAGVIIDFSSLNCINRLSASLPEVMGTTDFRSKVSDNTTQLLDELLTNYDSRLRPGFGGKDINMPLTFLESIFPFILFPLSLEIFITPFEKLYCL